MRKEYAAKIRGESGFFFPSSVMGKKTTRLGVSQLVCNLVI